MTLEMEQIEIGETHLAESGWKAGIAYDPEADAELMEDDKIEAIKREELNKNSGIWTCETLLSSYGVLIVRNHRPPYSSPGIYKSHKMHNKQSKRSIYSSVQQRKKRRKTTERLQSICLLGCRI